MRGWAGSWVPLRGGGVVPPPPRGEWERSVAAPARPRCVGVRLPRGVGF